MEQQRRLAQFDDMRATVKRFVVDGRATPWLKFGHSLGSQALCSGADTSHRSQDDTVLQVDAPYRDGDFQSCSRPASAPVM
jgi:hypothetical protein